MKKTILIYGLTLAVLVFVMKYLEYRLVVRDLSIEFYVGLVAVFFTVLGVWSGIRLTQKRAVANSLPFQIDDSSLERFGISKRELEVLQWMARGLSNQEIADKLFVSLNTVKTHSSNLFQKLDAKNRTQAVQKGRELGIIQ
jgi:DNA-binding CsgD family transcriptional regulator